jgi:hypothetical protein
MFGLDHLGIAKYGQVALQEHPNGWALGAFSNVSGFGDALPAVKAILDSGRCPRVRLQLYWSDNAGHKPSSDYLKVIEREAMRVARFLAPYVGKVDCRVSGFCEHPLDVRSADIVRQTVMKHMPRGVTYVNSYDLGLGGKPLPNCVNEVHGSSRSVPSGRFDFSYDGDNCFDSDVTADKIKFAKAETFYFWFPQCNGNPKLQPKPKIPRPNRVCYPTSWHIDAAIYLSRDVSGSKIPKGLTFKVVSDQHTNPPKGKDCKPVWITPVKEKYKRIELRAANGQVIDSAPYFGTLNNESGKVIGHRYYCGDWGYLLAEKARRIQNSNMCFVYADGKKVGVIVPATRAGSFR